MANIITYLWVFLPMVISVAAVGSYLFQVVLDVELFFLRKFLYSFPSDIYRTTWMSSYFFQMNRKISQIANSSKSNWPHWYDKKKVNSFEGNSFGRISWKVSEPKKISEFSVTMIFWKFWQSCLGNKSWKKLRVEQ